MFISVHSFLKVFPWDLPCFRSVILHLGQDLPIAELLTDTKVTAARSLRDWNYWRTQLDKYWYGQAG